MSKKFSFSLSISVEAPATEANEKMAHAIHSGLRDIVNEQIKGAKIMAQSFGSTAAPSTMRVEDLVYTLQKRGEAMAHLQSELDKLKRKPPKP